MPKFRDQTMIIFVPFQVGQKNGDFQSYCFGTKMSTQKYRMLTKLADPQWENVKSLDQMLKNQNEFRHFFFKT